MTATAAAKPLIQVDQAALAREDARQPLAERAGGAVTVSTSPDALLAAITAAASNPNIDVGKVERLFAIHQTVVQQEAEKAFNDAMARAQSEIQPVAARSYNSQTSSHYAKLEAIDKAITPAITKNGFSITYDTETRNDADPVPKDWVRIIAWVLHAAGHKKRYHIDLPPDGAGLRGNSNKTAVQAIASTNTYGRRYLKCMAFNVSTYDDKDGNSRKRQEPDAGEAGASTRREERREPEAPGEYPEKAFNENLPKWKQTMAEGKKTADQIIAMASSRYTLTDAQKLKIRAAAGVQS
jgi:hypothetical protein